ncbi:MAG: NYN domain-containing protein [Dehalococcoidia bacterium]
MVDRFAWFVDAGYLYAAGGQLCVQSTSRDQVEIRFATLIPALHRLAGEHAGIDLLRTYWYDGADNGVPTPTQLAVSHQIGVKLRLGRLSRGVQNGVDALIIRDLMKLSSEHAIVTAFLLSGDEDLRQGMIEAQDAGVKVVLVGVEPFGDQNQASTLIREADDILVLRRDFLDPHIQRRTSVRPPPVYDTPREDSPTSVGSQVADEFIATDRSAASALKLARAPNRSQAIPFEIDRRLLEGLAGPNRRPVPQEERHRARDDFWNRLAEGTADGS